MSDLILFSQQPPYQNFLSKISTHHPPSHRRATSHPHKPLKPKLMSFQPSEQIQASLSKLVKSFRDSLKAFLDHYNGIDFNYVIYTFKKQNILEELANMINGKLVEENRGLQEAVQVERGVGERLRRENQLLVEDRQQGATDKAEKKGNSNFSATNQEGNTELAKVLYEKAKEVGLEDFNEVVNSYFLQDKVKVTAIKDWPKGVDAKVESQVKQVLHQAIEEVRKTINKQTAKSSSEYIGNILRDHFVGKRQKFEIVAKMLTNDTILRYLQDMFESNGVPCPRPCCQIKNRSDILSITRQPTPKQSTRYLMSTKRSSDACYKSDQITNYMQKFNQSMRQRNAKQTDIRSISKTNLQATQSYQKFFNKQLNKRKKMEYKEKQKIDQQLRNFIRSIK